MPTTQGLTEFIDAVGTALKGVRDDAFYTQVTYYVAFMGYTILVWDHIITFGDEVRYVWQRPKRPATYLFFLNRYFTPVAFIGNLVAYFSQWPDEVLQGKICDHFVRYEGSCTVIALEVAALLMLLRVWALYKGHNMIIGSAVALLALETAVFAWLMTRAEPVTHDYTIRPCTMIFDPQLNGWPSLSAWLPLLFDTYATVLILYRCVPPVRRSSPALIFSTLLRDGLIYYSVIFLINLVLAIMIVAAPPAIKNVAAQLEQMLTVAMISRISLSLKRDAARKLLGLVTSNDDACHVELDSWRVRQLEPTHARAHDSSIVVQHINVMPGSYLTSESVLSAAAGGMLWDKSENDNLENARQLSGFGADSIGILSISLAHPGEAVVADITMFPVDRAAIIVEPSMLNEQNAYELRVMRPAHTATATNNVLHL